MLIKRVTQKSKYFLICNNKKRNEEFYLYRDGDSNSYNVSKQTIVEVLYL